MVDLFLEAGFTYFDTAHVYTGSEEAAKKALVERHPRESYTLATKLYAPSAPTEKAAKEHNPRWKIIRVSEAQSSGKTGK